MRSSAAAGRSTPQRALSRCSPELPPCNCGLACETLREQTHRLLRSS